MTEVVVPRKVPEEVASPKPEEVASPKVEVLEVRNPGCDSDAETKYPDSWEPGHKGVL